MRLNADFLAYAHDGRLVLAAEARNRPSAGQRWAAEFRRNLLAGGVIPAAPFFLLALRDRFFLWRPQAADPMSPPDYEADADDVLRPYLVHLRHSLGSLGNDSFDMLVSLWLDDVVHGTAGEQPLWMTASGLDRELRGGTIAMAPAT
ncbi:hypothetical protein [Longimicrobium terrae]|uniref:Uncharacterized protein n=1 Tax=Longimicrobium terrae TaxID=1639882 RepID=A0A841H2D0_9BACT|nr:hypothetical protein [Longimicrobium terrae]MBB4638004.1 hypothetical protein [Longimicrobium terrae]MBB6072251.1 hypothetical protein [Longimicrobium terrae]NNC28328.1 hypothetical protein [Longimicrobium terrae]